MIPLIVGVLAPEPETIIPAVSSTSKAHDFQVIEKDDLSFPGRKRWRWTIVAPTALTKEDRAETAKEAARQLQEETGADLADIWFEVAPFAKGQTHNQLALATYIPDGCGSSGEDCNGVQWEVSASDTQLTEQQVLVWTNWRRYREEFIVDGLLNEAKLKAYLSEKLNLPEDQIGLPWIVMEKISE